MSIPKKRKFLSKGHPMIMIVLRIESINKTKRKSVRRERKKLLRKPRKSQSCQIKIQKIMKGLSTTSKLLMICKFLIALFYLFRYADSNDDSEDEGIKEYQVGGYHPVHLGEVLIGRYVIV